MQKNESFSSSISGPQRVVDFLLETAWLITIFALPLVFFPNIFTTFELAKAAVFQGSVTLMFLLWVLKYFLQGTSPSVLIKSRKYIRTALALFLGFYILATVFSVAPEMSVFGWYPRFQGLFTLAGYCIFGLIVFFELRTEQQKKRLMLMMMASFLLVCAVALAQKFLPGFLQWWNDAAFNGRIYGTMANPNYLAAYIVMMLPLFVGNFFTKKLRIFSGVSLMLGIFALALTLSREGFLAAFLSLLFFFVVVAVWKRAKKTLAFLCILPFIFGGFVWYLISHQQESWVQNNPVLERLTTSQDNISSAQSRLEIWPAALHEILSSPFIGYGPETFAVTFPSFAPPTVNTREDQGEIVDHAHNELLDIAAQIGIPGMIAYLCFIFGLIVAGTRRFLKPDAVNGDQDSWLLLSLCSGVLGLFIANEFGFSVTVHWVLLVVFAAIILNTLHQKDFKTVHYQLHPAWKILFFVLVGVLSIGMFWLHDVSMVLADVHMRQGYDAIVGGDFPTTVTEYRTASQLAPVEAFYSLNFAYAELQRYYDGQKLSAVESVEAFERSLHAARLRGYDSFSLSVAKELQNTF